TDKQREYLSYITGSTNALLAIINNILDLASIDAGAMTLNLGAVDIRKTMEAGAEGVQDRLVKNGIRLEIRAAPEIGTFIADERRVRQLLVNLLANAVGFSPGGEVVTFAAQRRRDAIVFSVTDRGPGIPADVQGKVFDWFETHSLGSRHRGTGLGLSLVRSFVELHGGAGTLESPVRRGTPVPRVFPPRSTPQRSEGGRGGCGRPPREGASGHAMPLPASATSSFSVALPDEHATRRLAIDIANSLEGGDFVTLSGDLGAGKTTLVRTLIRYLAGDPAIEGPSPTFTLMQAYELPQFPLVHADLYRLAGPAELP